MRPRSACVVILAISMLANGCSRLTFIRPSLDRKTPIQVAPDYTVRTDPGSRKRVAAIDQLALSEQYLRNGQLDQAEAQAKAALKLDGKSSDAYTLLAVISGQRGNMQQAGAYYARAAELAPGKGAPMNNYGAWLCANGRAAESLTYFDRAATDLSYSTPASALANAGACALGAGQNDRAERDLRRAIALNPTDPVALGAMASLKFRRGEYLDARAFSQRRLATENGTSSESLLLASQIEEKLGDKTAAARYVQTMQALQQPAPPAQGSASQP